VPEVVFMRLAGSGDDRPTAIEVGRARVIDGSVQIAGDEDLGWMATTAVRHPDSFEEVLTAGDGVRYLLALPWTFHGMYFWASLKEIDTGGRPVDS